ncbi:hypothetical protein BTUL_0145g00230 [Botrytis tulipae]|uniref:Uncharacterized protein n=1 Tax=Botrytis tulipae TaxID=87230 RepID=A0A4Z1ECV5_9HELO|nr:hypothetical protein BTUL_0145g00230 [Botrytis tulipae]
MRICIGVSSSEDAECKSSSPSHDYHSSAVNPHANANSLASGGEWFFFDQISMRTVFASHIAGLAISSGRSESVTCASCAPVHTSSQESGSIDQVKKWEERKVSLLKISHKGRSFSSLQASRHE